MGSSISTLVGWTVVIGCIYVVVFGIPGKKNARDAVRGATQRQRLEDKQNTQSRKEPKDKAKRQRGEAYTKDADEANKASQLKARTSKPSAITQPANNSSEDDVDNREFARQLASVKQGTNLNAPKKSDEKRQKSVKQSRAQVIDEKPNDTKAVSAPSSTAGVDADDDESSTPSPELKATDISGVSDMLEPKASGPSVLRLTDTDKVKPKKEKKAKEPEKVETKKQRQNRQKAEAAKSLREETEKQRKVDMEAQRRQARIAEGRPAKDGSTFMAAQNQPSAWNSTTNGSSSSNATNGGFLPVQPLDTFDTSSYTDVSVPKDTSSTAVKSNPAKSNPADSWIATLPSEEEQMEMLRDEEAWNTVPNKKLNKKKNREAVVIAESPVDSEPATVVPAAKPRADSSNSTGASAPAPSKPTKPAFSQKSSFAALSTNDDDETEENEWEV